jgi:hypothetical protein
VLQALSGTCTQWLAGKKRPWHLAADAGVATVIVTLHALTLMCQARHGDRALMRVQELSRQEAMRSCKGSPLDKLCLAPTRWLSSAKISLVNMAGAPNGYVKPSSVMLPLNG